jgi:hypothetical protein
MSRLVSSSSPDAAMRKCRAEFDLRGDEQ